MPQVWWKGRGEQEQHESGKEEKGLTTCKQGPSGPGACRSKGSNRKDRGQQQRDLCVLIFPHSKFLYMYL